MKLVWQSHDNVVRPGNDEVSVATVADAADRECLGEAGGGDDGYDGWFGGGLDLSRTMMERMKGLERRKKRCEIQNMNKVNQYQTYQMG